MFFAKLFNISSAGLQNFTELTGCQKLTGLDYSSRWIVCMLVQDVSPFLNLFYHVKICRNNYSVRIFSYDEQFNFADQSIADYVYGNGFSGKVKPC